MNNRIEYRTYSPQHKKILNAAAKEHYTGRLSLLMKTWTVVIVRLVQAGVTPELLIGNADKLVEFCKKLKGNSHE